MRESITYHGKILTKIEKETGGKNPSGFYESKGTPKQQYFVKFPTDKIEFFCELFAGLIIRGLKPYLPQELKHVLICADLIEDKGTYGLIQAKREFTELTGLIGTQGSDGDRSASYEALTFGINYNQISSFAGYEKKIKPSLALCLLVSLMLGNYSVHSGNIVQLKGKAEFGQIDWGASFRYFFTNGDDLLDPAEYQGWSRWKRLTKGYILCYTELPHLFAEISQQAKSLLDNLKQPILASIVETAYSNIPSSYLTPTEKQKLYEYLGIKDIDPKDFSKIIANTIFKRLEQAKKQFVREIKPIGAQQQIERQAILIANQNEELATLKELFRTTLTQEQKEHKEAIAKISLYTAQILELKKVIQESKNTIDTLANEKDQAVEQKNRVNNTLRQQQAISHLATQRQQFAINYKTVMLLRYGLMWSGACAGSLLCLMGVAGLTAGPLGVFAAAGLVAGAIVGLGLYQGLVLIGNLNRIPDGMQAINKPKRYSVFKYTAILSTSYLALKLSLVLLVGVGLTLHGFKAMMAFSLIIGVGGLIGYGGYKLIKACVSDYDKQQAMFFKPVAQGAIDYGENKAAASLVGA